MTAGMVMACWKRPQPAAYPTAACKLACSVSSQAAACPGVDSCGTEPGCRAAGKGEMGGHLDGDVLGGGQRGVQVVVQQPAGRGIRFGGVAGGGQGAGVLTDQVVQPVAAGCGL